jgi:beta-lactamase class A
VAESQFRDVRFGGPRLSVEVRDAASGAVLLSEDADRVQRTASVGKILLLIEVAVRFADGRLRPEASLERTPDDEVSDSGLWQHLTSDALPAVDLAVLIGAVSDNLATNVLLRQVGLLAVHERARTLGLTDTRLHDRVRDHRRPSDPETLSTGSAVELSALMGRLHRGEVRSKAVSRQVLRWLALDTDTSMTAGAFGLDPLTHTEPDRGLTLAHKTGTDVGIRCDVGLIGGPARTLAYAVLAEFDDDDRDAVLGRMFAHGQSIRELAED